MDEQDVSIDGTVVNLHRFRTMHSRGETSHGRWQKINYQAENITEEINQICSP